MSYRVIHEKRQFSLAEGVPLPVDTRHHQVEGHHLFVSPEKAAYVVTDDVGASSIRRFLDGATLGEVLSTVGPELDRTSEEVQASLHNLLVQVERNGFSALAEPLDDDAVNTTVLCYLTNLCNLQCTHCYQEAGPEAGLRDELTAAEWGAIFRDFGTFLASRPHLPGKITLSGGEPLAHRNFWDVLASAREQDVLVEVFTNGTLIRNGETARRLADHTDLVQISLDGATAPVNDAIRGSGSHRKILRALHLMAETEVHIRLAVTLMPANAEDLAEHLIPTIEEIGRGRVELRIGLANVQGRAESWVRFQDTVEGERALRDLLEQLYRRSLRRPRQILPNLLQKSCGYGRSMTVASDGTVYGCAIQSFPLGNVRQRSFLELVRQGHHLGEETEVDRLEECRDCDLRYFCNGGCRLNNFFRHQDLFKTACTPAKREELKRKLVYRELAGDPLLVASQARVTGFWDHA